MPGTGHRASDWQAAGKPVWEGRLRVVSRGKTVTIELLEADGRLFAQAPVRSPGEPGPPSVEKVVDSSRYFAVCIENRAAGKVQRAFIGIGFNDRNEAFDFNVALQEGEKYKGMDADGNTAEARAAGKAAAGGGGAGAAAAAPAKDFSLKEGETIHVKLSGKRKPKKKKHSGGGGLTLAPPAGRTSLGAPPRSNRARGSPAAAAPAAIPAPSAPENATPGLVDGFADLKVSGGGNKPAAAAATTAAPAADDPFAAFDDSFGDFGGSSTAAPADGAAKPAGGQQLDNSDWVSF